MTDVIFDIIFSIINNGCQVVIASWLTLQYRFNHNYLNIEARIGAQLLL